MQYENLIMTALSAIFGSTGLIALYKTRQKERVLLKRESALAKIEEINVVKSVEEMYASFLVHYRREMDDMKVKIGIQDQEIKMLSAIVEGYKAKCEKCTNNIIEKK